MRNAIGGIVADRQQLIEDAEILGSRLVSVLKRPDRDECGKI
jgi:hypothetical protein